jgi:hypothetical protein
MTAVGYESESGSVRYYLTHPYVFEELMTHLGKRVFPQITTHSFTAKTEEEFFDDKRFEVENTAWRVLFMLDNTAVCHNRFVHGKIVYKLDR